MPVCASTGALILWDLSLVLCRDLLPCSSVNVFLLISRNLPVAGTLHIGVDNTWDVCPAGEPISQPFLWGMSTNTLCSVTPCPCCPLQTVLIALGISRWPKLGWSECLVLGAGSRGDLYVVLPQHCPTSVMTWISWASLVAQLVKNLPAMQEILI